MHLPEVVHPVRPASGPGSGLGRRVKGVGCGVTRGGSSFKVSESESMSGMCVVGARKVAWSSDAPHEGVAVNGALFPQDVQLGQR